MNLSQLIFLILISVVFALLEVQIEGTGSWAKNLPTWRINNPFKKYLAWPTLIDGYHLYLWMFLILMFHLPYAFGIPFSKVTELTIIEMLLIVLFLEDFLWFVFNPAWGIKKFFSEEIPWHGKRFLFLPQNYWLSFAILAVFEIIKNKFI